jgi:hypothetical protein
VFWSTHDFDWLARLERVADVPEEFKSLPLTILALHDASIPSVDAFKTAVAPLLDRFVKQPAPPSQLLLDRAPSGQGFGPLGLQSGQRRLGRTADAYQVGTGMQFLIDQKGQLAYAFRVSLVEGEGFAMDKDGKLDPGR